MKKILSFLNKYRVFIISFLLLLLNVLLFIFIHNLLPPFEKIQLHGLYGYVRHGIKRGGFIPFCRSTRMQFLPRNLTAAFCFSWYAHIVAILRRKTYLIQPVIQLSRFIEGFYPLKLQPAGYGVNIRQVKMFLTCSSH